VGRVVKEADALDRAIVISDNEQRQRALSVENRRLGTLLLHARGFVVLKNAVPLDLTDELRRRFADIYADCAASNYKKRGVDAIKGDRTGTMFWERIARFRIFPRLTGPFADPYILANPFALGILKESLGDRLYCKSVASDTCVKGAMLQAPHRDLDFYDGQKPFGATVNIPIMHCGLHNGPLEVWPGGSHLWHGGNFFRFGVLPFTQDGENPQAEAFTRYIPSKKVELFPGDLLIRDPGMWHRGTPNPTDEPRTMLTQSFFRTSFYYDYGDPLHSIDKKLFDALDPSIKPYFSYCFDKTDPLYWKLHRTRAIQKIEKRRVLGAPFRIGGRWLERARDAVKERGY
jgi:ectoine hydroxylase-related dioxygenase (phytanoyl-CoA dioxygenase family)